MTLDLDDLCHDISDSMYADDRQTGKQLDAGFAALGTLRREVERLTASFDMLDAIAATGRLGPVQPMYSEVGGVRCWRVTIYATQATGNIRPECETFEGDTLEEALTAAMDSL